MRRTRALVSPLARRTRGRARPRPRPARTAPAPTDASSSATSRPRVERRAPGVRRRRRRSARSRARRPPRTSTTSRSPRSARRSRSGSRESIGPIPTFYLTAEFDMERAARCARRMSGDGRRVQGLVQRHHPQGDRHGARAASGSATRTGSDDHIRYWHRVHLGMAVAIEDGLITPVIRDADRKRLREIARESKRAREARARAQAHAGGVHRRDLLRLEPRHVRHRPVHRDHQPAGGGDPRRSARSSDRAGGGVDGAVDRAQARCGSR